MSEREEAGIRERDNCCQRSSLCFRVLLLLLVLILSLRKLWGFLLYGFFEENSSCLLSLVFIAVHVILSDKILRSYCLNDKNLTNSPFGNSQLLEKSAKLCGGEIFGHLH